MIPLIALIFILILFLLYYLQGKPDVSLTKSRGSATRLSHSVRSKVRQKWQEITELSKVDGYSASNQAVIKADQLLDLVLEEKGLGGSLGEKLKQAKDHFKSYENYDDAWKAHKIRNSVVHQTDFDLNKRALKTTLKKYQSALKDLGAL